MELADGRPTPDSLEKQFNFDHINYDQVNGIGNVPNNQNIHYMGFTVMTTPLDYLQLVPRRPWDDNIDFLVEALRNNKAISTPFLSIDLIGTVPEVAAHDGRGRVMAIQKIRGRDTPIIVQMFTRGIRARNITTTMIRLMRDMLKAQDSGVLISGPNFWPAVCLQNRWIDIIDEVAS